MGKSQKVATNAVTAFVIPNAPKCTPELGEAIRKNVGIKDKAAKNDTALGNLMVALGWLSTDCISPKSTKSKSTATTEQYNWTKGQIVGSWSKAVQEALAAPSTKGLSPTKLALRKEYQPKIGSYMGNLKSLLQRRESTRNGVPNADREWEAVLYEKLEAAVKRANNDVAVMESMNAAQIETFTLCLGKAMSVLREVAKKR